MSWKREHAHALAPPDVSKLTVSSRRNPSNLMQKPRLNSAFAPGTASGTGATHVGREQVWRAHDPSVDPFLTARDTTTPTRKSSSSSQSRERHREGSCRSVATQTDAWVSSTASDDDLSCSFGSIHSMSMETVDFLMHLLTQRKQQLDDDDAAESEASTTNSAATAGPIAVGSTVPPLSSIELHENDQAERVCAAPPSSSWQQQLPRSRSYEALVQLEAILETRHRQLMEHGVLDEGALPPPVAGEARGPTYLHQQFHQSSTSKYAASVRPSSSF
ncbi:Aste57867_2679 [Aphanomyces stellatus]|uniref:Aste57867_2679 protein n=1 Tax=Aphanomyces stellatus TaxID=120398 RepID=A0A485KDS8_9STRA|nr:hypothetical protein As57867_002672 [Aphanomyces stellatus]VFT79873.1 Aste57867_2679 [Aphanomyces stellatus]